MAGELLGVTATDALELGIDIGSLDCAISVGFPGHGLVAAPAVGTGRPPRAPASPSSSRARTRSTSTSCASRRRCSREPSRRRSSTTRTRASSTGTSSPPPSRGRSTRPTRETLGPEALVRAAELPELKLTDAGWVWAGKDYPAARVLLRSGELDSFTVVDAETGAVLGTGRALAGVLERSTTAPSTSTSASSTSSSRLDVDARAALVTPRERRLVHAGEGGDARRRSSSRCARSAGSVSS